MTKRNEYHIFKADEIPCQEISDSAVLSKNPLVSVKMITYNHESYITQAIEGVVNQKTDFPFELIIGEDCSTDRTMDIVLEYQKKYPDIIRVITSDKNIGAKKNGYRTEMACRGKYIAYCEGDDYWHRFDKLQLQVDYMESHPECGLIHSDYDRFFIKSGNLIKNFNRKMNNKPSNNLDISSILRGGKYLYILTCTVMVRKNILHEVTNSDPLLYQSAQFLIGDTPRWAEIAYCSATHYIDESLSTYNVLSISASKNIDPIKQLKFGKSVSEIKLYLVDKYNLPVSERYYHTKEWCQSTLPLAFYQRDKVLANYLKTKMKYFSVKEKIFYYGVTNNSIYKLIVFLLRFRGKILQLYNRD